MDLEKPAEEPEPRSQKTKRLVDHHPLAKAGKKYASAASDWFRDFDEQRTPSNSIQLAREHHQSLDDPREVIQWYQYQIAVKTMRALSTRNEELHDSEAIDFPKDSDGSAKVALIGIDRSIAAWRLMQLSLPDRSESIVPLILQLACLHNSLNNSFPDAPHFVRPGFDEVFADTN